MTRNDGSKVRLSAGNWIALSSLVVSVIVSVVGSVVYQASTTAELGAILESHNHRITRLENNADARRGR